MRTAAMLQEPYLEQVRLSTGELVRIRLVGPEDKRHLKSGFYGLSADSRYKRFLNEKKHISDAELIYFTEVDQVDHFVLGIVELDEHGEEGEGLAIGRFIRLRDDAKCAEVGLTVIDRMQGKGVGRVLLEKLVSAGLELDIKRFRFECLSRNYEMKKLVLKVCREVTFKSDAGVLVAEAVLASHQSTSPASSALDVIDGMISLIQNAASETLKLQSDIGLEMMRRSLGAPFASWSGQVKPMSFWRRAVSPWRGDQPRLRS